MQLRRKQQGGCASRSCYCTAITESRNGGQWNAARRACVSVGSASECGCSEVSQCQQVVRSRRVPSAPLHCWLASLLSPVLSAPPLLSAVLCNGVVCSHQTVTHGHRMRSAPTCRQSNSSALADVATSSHPMAAADLRRSRSPDSPEHSDAEAEGSAHKKQRRLLQEPSHAAASSSDTDVVGESAAAAPAQSERAESEAHTLDSSHMHPRSIYRRTPVREEPSTAQR